VHRYHSNSLNIRKNLTNPRIPATPNEQKKNIGNPNHPERESTIKVEPIKKLKDIKAIKKSMANKCANILTFIVKCL